jgi:pyruvate/2-oxoglutarate/acetoin dehydrogenase E1 component
MRCSGSDVPMPYAGALEQAALPQEDSIIGLAKEIVA